MPPPPSYIKAMCEAEKKAEKSLEWFLQSQQNKEYYEIRMKTIPWMLNMMMYKR